MTPRQRFAFACAATIRQGRWPVYMESLQKRDTMFRAGAGYPWDRLTAVEIGFLAAWYDSQEIARPEAR